ncbi:MAG TPA: molybdate ABC transporter permease subunit [Vicinamibacterales bacterium]|jgi:molybdate transport system permease protein|nr:molybdate ABC transporter permease subunit [Vicinamibacterales bacterium]
MDWQAIWLTAKLAAIVSSILLVASLPLAHWLTFSRRRWTFLIESVVSLPLVLPPTVIGFYLLMAMGSRSPIGRWWMAWTGHGLAFTFEGLIVASVLYSLPFALQPIAAAFAQVEPSLREASVTLGASSLRTFVRITLPLSIEGVIAGLVLSFAHTVGEFGVVLMVGGNLPGITRTVSIAIYDHVQGLQYREANVTALALLAFSFVVLLAVYGLRRRPLAAAPLA